MDPKVLAWGVAILGCVLGILGGVVGTYCSIRATRGPRERAFVIRACVVIWAFVTAFVAALLLLEGWYKHLLWVPYAVLLVVGIRLFNRGQERVRREETGEAPAGGVGGP